MPKRLIALRAYGLIAFKALGPYGSRSLRPYCLMSVWPLNYVDVAIVSIFVDHFLKVEWDHDNLYRLPNVMY